MEGLTDAGLISLAQLGNLKSLTLNCWNAVYLTQDGIDKLLKSLQGKQGLEELTLIHPYLSDAALSVLGQCKTIKSLTLKGGAMLSISGLEKLIQSSCLKATLAHFHVVAKYDRKLIAISDALLGSLSSCSQLKSLSLEGDWQVTEPQVLKFLEASKKLSRIVLRGLPITDAIAEKIGKYDQLNSLSLSDCSKLTLDGYLNLLMNKDFLAHLELGNAIELANIGRLDKVPFLVLSKLPTLSSLTLSGCTNVRSVDFSVFCNSEEMIKNLKKLSITGFTKVDSNSLGEISLLVNLNTLHIDNCPWFNSDALESFTKSNISYNLEELYLNKVAITDYCITRLNKFTNLKKLMLGNCYALTEGRIFEGREALFDLEIKTQLIGLALDHYLFADKHAELFANFTALQVLWVFNNSELTEQGLQSLEQIKNNRGTTFNFVVEYGDEGINVHDFAQAVICE
jgi:hypothetical protein